MLAENPRTDAKKDTERCARLAAEIEAREGRKVEQMRRKILQEGVCVREGERKRECVCERERESSECVYL